MHSPNFSPINFEDLFQKVEPHQIPAGHSLLPTDSQEEKLKAIEDWTSQWETLLMSQISQEEKIYDLHLHEAHHGIAGHALTVAILVCLTVSQWLSPWIGWPLLAVYGVSGLENLKEIGQILACHDFLAACKLQIKEQLDLFRKNLPADPSIILDEEKEDCDEDVLLWETVNHPSL
jgi:hypothetical protein